MEKKINKILIKGSSSESELHCIANALNLKINFIGSMYELNKFIIGNYIILISPSKKVHNGHWVSLKIGKNKSYYFDPFGMPPIQIIVKNVKNPIYYNNDQIQDMRSSHCGIYSIYFLKEGPSMIKHFKIHNVY